VIADRVVEAWATRNPALADRLAPTIASQLLAHAGGQATLGTDVGRTKALQLVDAAEGTLWPHRQEAREQNSAPGPTVPVSSPSD
jgi:hypothetical protein